jgi:four helix bundle protein
MQNAMTIDSTKRSDITVAQKNASAEPARTGSSMAEQKLPFARSFKELAVYQKARMLNRKVCEISKRFPKEEAYSLTSQLRRASRSIGAQIAEAWAERRYPAYFTSKLTDSDGEQQETQHWTIVAFDDGYISRAEAQSIGNLALEVGRMLSAMIENAESFRGEDYVLKETFDPGSHLNTEY